MVELGNATEALARILGAGVGETKAQTSLETDLGGEGVFGELILEVAQSASLGQAVSPAANRRVVVGGQSLCAGKSSVLVNVDVSIVATLLQRVAGAIHVAIAVRHGIGFVVDARAAVANTSVGQAGIVVGVA